MVRDSFLIKYMIRDGEDCPQALDQFGGSVLGLPWDTQTDTIQMKQLTINLSKKTQKLQEVPAITPDRISEVDEAVLTLRMMTSQVYGIYNPLGLLCPITIK